MLRVDLPGRQPDHTLPTRQTPLIIPASVTASARTITASQDVPTSLRFQREYKPDKKIGSLVFICLTDLKEKNELAPFSV